MDTSKVIPVICITLFIVAGINAAIYAWARNKDHISQIELFQRAARASRNPWQSEDSILQELAEKVAKIRNREESNQKE